MENVIAGILEIENKAKERLEEAEKMKNKIIADAKAERENMLKIKIKEAEEKLGRMDSEEKKRAEERLEETEKARSAAWTRFLMRNAASGRTKYLPLSSTDSVRKSITFPKRGLDN